MDIVLNALTARELILVEGRLTIAEVAQWEAYYQLRLRRIGFLSARG